MTKNWKIIAENNLILFWSNIEIHLFLGLHKRRPSYRRSSVLKREHPASTSKLENFFTFSIFVSLFCPLGSGFRSGQKWLRIQIRKTLLLSRGVAYSLPMMLVSSLVKKASTVEKKSAMTPCEGILWPAVMIFLCSTPRSQSSSLS